MALVWASVEEARRITETAKKLKMIGMVTSISEYVPSQKQQEKRIPHIQEIQDSLTNNRSIAPFSEGQLENLIAELYRVEDNVIELAQLIAKSIFRVCDLRRLSALGIG